MLNNQTYDNTSPSTRPSLFKKYFPLVPWFLMFIAITCVSIRIISDWSGSGRHLWHLAIYNQIQAIAIYFSLATLIAGVICLCANCEPVWIYAISTSLVPYVLISCSGFLEIIMFLTMVFFMPIWLLWMLLFFCLPIAWLVLLVLMLSDIAKKSKS